VSNGKRPNGVVLTIMGTLLILGVAAVFGLAMSSNADQSSHESNKEAHGIDVIAQSVGKIADDVGTMRVMQARQTVMLENMSEDISELKDGG